MGVKEVVTRDQTSGAMNVSVDADTIDGIDSTGFVLFGAMGRWPSGATLQAEGVTSTLGLTNNRLYYTPIWVPEARTTANMQIETTIAGSGGTPVARVGLYSPDANGRPGALLVEAGTIDVTVTPAVLSKTVSQALPRGLIWAAYANQGATTTQPTVRIITGSSRFVNLTDLVASSNRCGYIQDSVSGALPANATPLLTTATTAPMIGLKAA